MADPARSTLVELLRDAASGLNVPRTPLTTARSRCAVGSPAWEKVNRQIVAIDEAQQVLCDAAKALSVTPSRPKLTQEQADEIEAEMRRMEADAAVDKRAIRLFMQSPMPCGHCVGDLMTCLDPPFGCASCLTAAALRQLPATISSRELSKAVSRAVGTLIQKHAVNNHALAQFDDYHDTIYNEVKSALRAQPDDTPEHTLTEILTAVWRRLEFNTDEASFDQLRQAVCDTRRDLSLLAFRAWREQRPVERPDAPPVVPKCRRCCDTGFVSYWDGSAQAGESCPDCDPESPTFKRPDESETNR